MKILKPKLEAPASAAGVAAASSAGSGAMWGGIAAGAGSVLGSAVGAIGASSLNLANREWSAQQAQIQRNWEAQQQQIAMNYNTMMSDTAIQRRMKDAAAAGVNPMLAVTSGGASAPMMGAPSGATAANPQTTSPLGTLGAGISQGAQTAAQVALLDAQTRKTNADASNVEATNPYSAAGAAANLKLVTTQINNNLAQLDNIAANTNVATLQKFAMDQDMRFKAQLQPLVAQQLRLSNQAAQLGMTRAQVESQFFETDVGQAVLKAQMAHGFGGDLAGTAMFLATSPKPDNLGLEPPGEQAPDQYPLDK